MRSCFGLFMLVVIACNDPSSVPVPSPADTTTTIDTLFSLRDVDPDDTDTPTTFVPGFYTGTIPCNDCSNITRKVLLLADHTFHLKDEFNGRDLPPQESEGRWLTTSDQLQLFVNNALTKRFAVTNKGLKEVSLTGAPMINSNTYLSRTIIGADNIAWMEKKAAGIDFFALGNEPFWLMEIDKDKQISFLQVDSTQPVVFPYVAATQQNGQYIYNTETSTAGMQIIITPMFCSDGMSDNWYEYKVEAKYNGLTYIGCGVKLSPDAP